MSETLTQPPVARRTKGVSKSLIGLRLTPEERQAAVDNARKEGRSASNFVRYIYLRGLADYLNSGASHG